MLASQLGHCPMERQLEPGFQARAPQLRTRLRLMTDKEMVATTLDYTNTHGKPAASVKHPPAEPGALKREPLKAAERGR
jgi:hypothetical protein